MFDIIQELCHKNGTTVTALCKYITGSSGNLPTWKRGNVRNDYLLKIAEYFNVSTDYLLGKTENPTTTNDSEGKVSDDDIKFALFNGSEDITDEMFDEVKRFAQHIANEKKRKANEKV